MKLFTIHEQTSGSLGLYLGVATGTTSIELCLSLKGINIKRENVYTLLSGKWWSKEVVIIPHEVEEQLFTVELLTDLKLRGTKAAEALLSERNRRAEEAKASRKK